VPRMSMPPPPPPFGSDQPQPGYGQPPAYGQQPGYGGAPAYPGGAYGGYQAGPSYAGFGSRLGALVIDGLIQGIFTIPVWIALKSVPTKIEGCTVNDEARLCEVPTGSGWAIIIAVGLAVGIAYLVWMCRMLGKGQTVGMKATSIRLADAQTGQPVGTGRAVGRYFASILSAIPCYLGYFWNLWDGKKQTWHDKLINAVVVKS